MKTITLQRGSPGYPLDLEHMHQPPPKLYVRGGNLTGLLQRPRVAIVGSRLITTYGRQVTKQLATQLAEQGVLIISGLALGVDAEAHKAALEAGGLTVAVLPSPVERIVPATNYWLAEKIVASGGAVISTYPINSPNHKGNFVARNEVVAALCNVLLITEAGINSGSRHTVDFAHNLGKDVMAVPGPITSPMSVGTNNQIKTGAALVNGVDDVLRMLGITPAGKRPAPRGSTLQEQTLLDLLGRGVTDGDELLAASQLSVEVFNQTLTMLEITAKILPLGANRWGLP